MNLCNAQAASCREDNNNSGGGGALRGTFDAAPANSLTVGAVGFGPTWSDEPSLRELYDTACASIVRAECEADELRAEVALAEAERIEMAKMLRSEREMHAACQNERDALQEQRDEERLRVRSLNAFASSLVKTIGELKAERVELKATINTYRDDACRDKCRDKAAADGGWHNG
jgi:ATP-dependent Lon protease